MWWDFLAVEHSQQIAHRIVEILCRLVQRIGHGDAAVQPVIAVFRRIAVPVRRADYVTYRVIGLVLTGPSLSDSEILRLSTS